ncbi:MAG: c-type cytochrome, partial [Planctomycetes bacterium]|nr:c-type cytochrome [Planctomycetota bacterium]
GGQLLGQVLPGLPNSRFALQTLTEEIRATKLQMQKPLTRMDLGSLVIPLGTTRGTTNAVMFGVVLLALRDADLNLASTRSLPALTHHDMDAPPWWHFHKKRHIYIDGFAEKGHRGLMQFMLVKENGPEKFREWEQDFRDVYAYLDSLRPPAYPFAIDAELAREGRTVFDRVCADCHGTYGQHETYPDRLVPIDEVQTDRVRLDALTAEHRERYAASWFADYGQQETLTDPGGYVAPPLDGIWASAPYFHNGSVPTLWHVLHSDQRPVVWTRIGQDYDQQRLGPVIKALEQIPAEATAAYQRREYFDTRMFGKSATGHRFPDILSEAEKHAVLEYLKTL